MFKHAPYAQNVGASQAVLIWSQDTGGATITYGPKGGATTMVAEAASGNGRHEVTLGGLQAGIRYAYSIALVGGGQKAGEFSTAAPASQAFSFLFFGDNRTNTADHQSVVDAMAPETADFVLNLGDTVEYPLASYFDTFFSIEEPLLGKNASFTTIGDTEYAGGAGVTQWTTEFANPTASSGTETHYSFDWGNSRFVVLDTNTNSAGQATWLDSVLADARAKNFEHLFVEMHWGPYDSGAHGENTTAQPDWVPLLQKYEIDIILSSHDHDYERGFNASTNLRYMVSGGGGAPLYTTNSQKPYQQVFVSTLHYVKFDVDGPTVNVVARKPDGTIIDSFSWSTAAADGGVPTDAATDAGADADADATELDAADDSNVPDVEVDAGSGGSAGASGGSAGMAGSSSGGRSGATDASVGGGAPDAASGGAAAGGTGGKKDAGGGDAAGAAPGDDGSAADSGCGCRVGPLERSADPLWLGLALAVLGRVRRRRK